MLAKYTPFVRDAGIGHEFRSANPRPRLSPARASGFRFPPSVTKQQSSYAHAYSSFVLCGMRESNPHLLLGKQPFYH